MPKQSNDESFVPEDDGALTDGEAGMSAPDADLAQQPPDSRGAPKADAQNPDDIESLRAELEEARQRTLRVQAELENYRKRAQRSQEEERRYAALPLLQDLLSVVDNLQRAIESSQRHENAAGLLDGVRMVLEQFTGVLARHHCQEIQAEGRPFDPHLHEAIAQFPSEGHEPGHVMQVTQTGYRLHDRVVRPTQVIVAGAKPQEP